MASIPAALLSGVLLCCLVIFCCSRALPGQVPPTWNPKKTWVFLVCLLEWHGKPYLATYDASTGTLGWAFEEIPDAIEKNFVGSHAVIALDNCYSGAMANAVKKSNRRMSYAVLASSLASQESTGNWTFTESLISAFSGSPIADANHDGVVSM